MVLEKEKKEQIAHKLREAYGNQQWMEFLCEDRRDAKLLVQEGVDQYPVKAAERLRCMKAMSPELRSVVNGSFASVAATAAMDESGRTEKRCPWCQDPDAVADWDHCAWKCVGRAVKVKTPRNPVQRRLAWPTEDNEQHNNEIYAVAEEVVRKTWRWKYGKDGYNSETAKPCENAKEKSAARLGA